MLTPRDIETREFSVLAPDIKPMKSRLFLMRFLRIIQKYLKNVTAMRKEFYL